MTSDLAVEARAVAQRPFCCGTEGSAMISSERAWASREEKVWARRPREALSCAYAVYERAV